MEFPYTAIIVRTYEDDPGYTILATIPLKKKRDSDAILERWMDKNAVPDSDELSCEIMPNEDPYSY